MMCDFSCDELHRLKNLHIRALGVIARKTILSHSEVIR